MESDYDNQVGFWIKGAPYLWVQGKTPYDSKRFYILYNISVFDQKDHILNPEFIQTALFRKKLDPAETFSIVPFPKEKECQMVKDYFLAWTFSNPAASTMLRFSYSNGEVFPWTDKADIRVEGQKIGKKRPERTNLIGLGGTLEIINHKPPFHSKITTIPEKFGIPLDISPNWVKGELEYYSKGKDTKHFYNILEVQQELGLTDKELRDVHVGALYNSLADLYIKKKKEKDTLDRIGVYPPFETLGGVGEGYNRITLYIELVTKQLEDFGEKPRGDEKLKYGWIYPDDYLISTHKTLYDIASGKRLAYPARDPVTGEIYPVPDICYISSPLKDWIREDGYYPDRNRRWKSEFSDRDGYQELCLLSHEVQKLLNANMRMMESKYSNKEIDRIIRKGVEIYARKPSLKTGGVTWSQGDYSHLGLQREYLRYKSIQRFTETWEMLRSANNLGLLRKITDNHTSRTIRVCSMAGGPGFELYAIQRFFHKYYPYIKVEGASLDLEESWRPYAELLGFRFKLWNTSDGKNFIQKCGGKIDLAIVSYSLHMYMSGDEHIKWLSELIRSGEIPLLFVNSRMKNLSKHKSRMIDKGVVATLLLDQSRRRDDRQMVYHSPKLKVKPPSKSIKVMFPNVPFV